LGVRPERTHLPSDIGRLQVGEHEAVGALDRAVGSVAMDELDGAVAAFTEKHGVAPE
jgi:hypothetical protein